jgi:PAS domain S-box-containing protein
MKGKPVILIVDDQPQNIELLEAQLVSQSYEIVKAANGEEALGKLSGNQIDLILLDVMMPGMDGFEVTRRVRQDDTHRLLPIILVTALRETEERVKGIEAGCDDFISKPVDKMELLARVRSLLKVKAYNDLMSNYQKELESEVTGRTEELKRAFIFQQRLIDALPVPVFYKDSEGRYLGCNSAFEKLFGKKREQVTGKSVYELSPKEFADIYHEKDRALLQNPGIQIYESVVKDTGGVVHNVIFHKATFPNMDGSVGGLTGAILDITDRKALEEALAVSEARFRNMIERDADGILIVDSNGAVRFANPAAEVLFSCKTEEFVGQLFGFPLVAGETTELDIVHGKAGKIIAEMRVVELDWEGEHAYLASLRDITERKQMHDQLEQTRQQQLQLKDQLFSHISHELRSPLSVIHQFVTILLDRLAGDLTVQQNEFLEITLQNVNQLRTMIDDLLEVTRAGTGKLSFEPQVTSVAEIVAETLEALKTRSIEKGVVLSDDVPWVLPLIFGDPQRVRQILINLIDNAIKFTTKDGTITVRAQVSDQDSDFLCVAVADTGCGINSDDVKNVFERLYQARSIAESCRKGLGLGLCICQELVSLHGGRIWVESQIGKGSTFSFTLPILSLKKLFASIPKNLLTGSVALISVEVSSVGNRLLTRDDELVLRGVRNALNDCILFNRDVLLPRMSGTKLGEIILIMACTDQKGAKALVERIRGQLMNYEDLKNTKLGTTVSFTMVNIPPEWDAMPLEQFVRYISSNIEGKMKND